jgi:gluconokinase
MTESGADVVIAVDMGSGGVRSAAVNAAGQVLAQWAVDGATDTDASGRSTHRTEDVWKAVVETVRRVTPSGPVAAVCLGGTAHALVTGTLDQPSPDIILWSDTRAAADFRALEEGGFFHGYSPVTGCPPDHSYWPAKIAWLIRSGRLGRTRAQVFSEKDLVFYRLTGEAVMDTSTAGATGLLDAARLDWAEGLSEALGAPWLCLPDLAPATAWRPLSAAGAAATGLPTGTPIVIGGVDGPLAQIGVGGSKPEIASLTIGTSLAVRRASRTRLVDAEGRLWSYALAPDLWVVGGAGSNGGNVLTWLHRAVAGGQVPISELVAQALDRPSDPTLVFSPSLHGERAPLWRADLAGGMAGLRPHHDALDIVRAGLDAVSALVYELAGAVTGLAGPADFVGLNGGFTASPGWSQLAVDAAACPGGVPEPDLAVNLGAARLAWAALAGGPIVAQPSVFRSVWRPRPDSTAAIAATSHKLAMLRDAVAVPPG